MQIIFSTKRLRVSRIIGIKIQKRPFESLEAISKIKTLFKTLPGLRWFRELRLVRGYRS